MTLRLYCLLAGETLPGVETVKSMGLRVIVSDINLKHHALKLLTMILTM